MALHYFLVTVCFLLFTLVYRSSLSKIKFSKLVRSRKPLKTMSGDIFSRSGSHRKSVTWKDEVDFESTSSESSCETSEDETSEILEEEVYVYDAEVDDDEDERIAAEEPADDLPVQIRKPRTKRKTPADRLHLAVWNNDPNLVQYLVLREGSMTFFPRR